MRRRLHPGPIQTSTVVRFAAVRRRYSRNCPSRTDKTEKTRMRNLLSIIAVSFLALFSFGQVMAQSPPAATLIQAGHLLDPRTGNVLSPAAVLIQANKIAEV